MFRGHETPYSFEGDGLDLRFLRSYGHACKPQNLNYSVISHNDGHGFLVKLSPSTLQSSIGCPTCFAGAYQPIHPFGCPRNLIARISIVCFTTRLTSCRELSSRATVKLALAQVALVSKNFRAILYIRDGFASLIQKTFKIIPNVFTRFYLPWYDLN